MYPFVPKQVIDDAKIKATASGYEPNSDDFIKYIRKYVQDYKAKMKRTIELQRHLELLRFQQPQDNIDAQKPSPYDPSNGEQLDDFFYRFEIYCKLMRLDDRAKAVNVTTLLPPELAAGFETLTLKERTSYISLKSALSKIAKLNPENNFCKNSKQCQQKIKTPESKPQSSNSLKPIHQKSVVKDASMNGPKVPQSNQSISDSNNFGNKKEQPIFNNQQPRPPMRNITPITNFKNQNHQYNNFYKSFGHCTEDRKLLQKSNMTSDHFHYYYYYYYNESNDPILFQNEISLFQDDNQPPSNLETENSNDEDQVDEPYSDPSVFSLKESDKVLKKCSKKLNGHDVTIVPDSDTQRIFVDKELVSKNKFTGAMANIKQTEEPIKPFCNIQSDHPYFQDSDISDAINDPTCQDIRGHIPVSRPSLDNQAALLEEKLLPLVTPAVQEPLEKEETKLQSSIILSKVETTRSQEKKQENNSSHILDEEPSTELLSRTQFPKNQVLIMIPTNVKKLSSTWKNPNIIVKKDDADYYSLSINGKENNYHVNQVKLYYPTGDKHYDIFFVFNNATSPAKFLLMHNEALKTPLNIIEEKDFENDPALDFNFDLHLKRGTALTADDENSPVKDNYDIRIPTYSNEVYVECSNAPEPSKHQTQDITALLSSFKSIITNLTGLNSTLEHNVEFTTDAPIKHSYKIHHSLSIQLKEDNDNWLKLSIVESSTSPYCSPLLAVHKSDGSHRFYHECKTINNHTKFDSEKFVDTQELFFDLRSAKYLTKMNLSNSLWQIPLSLSTKKINAFSSRYGHFHRYAIPSNHVNAPASFSCFMRIMTNNLQDVYVYVKVLIANST